MVQLNTLEMNHSGNLFALAVHGFVISGFLYLQIYWSPLLTSFRNAYISNIDKDAVHCFLISCSST